MLERDSQRRGGLVRHLTALVSALALTATALITIPSTAAAAADAPPIVFILDASGSMVRDTSPGVTRMDVAKSATIDTLASLPDDSQVGVLVFGTGTGNTDAERAAGCSDVTTLAPVGPLDVTALSGAIDGVKESGFTPIGPALRQAVGMLPAGEPGTIVLVSDGVDTCSPPSSCEVASELHRDNPLLTINVVGFGVDDDEAAQQQMTCIGGVGGGTAVSASDPAQLVSRLRAAAATSTDPSALNARGMNGVQLGMSLAEVRAAVDGAKVSDPKTENGVVIVYVDCGWGTVELRDDRVYGITPDDDSAPTAEGLAAGDTLADVEAIYGAPVPADIPVTDTFVYQAQPGSRTGYRVAFDPDTQLVRYIVVCRCVASSVISPAVQDWEIDYDAVGPLVLGMTVDAARAAVPQLTPGYSETEWVVDDGAVSAIFRDGLLAKVTINGYQASGTRLPHARGIRLGDVGAPVQNVFPGGTYRSYRVSGTSEYLAANRQGRLLTFAAEGSAVMSGSSITEWFAVAPLQSIVLEDATSTYSTEAYDELFGS